MQGRVSGDRFDSAHHASGGSGFAEVFEHHHHRPKGADRVGQTLAHDVEGRAVDRLEHRRITALGVDVASWRDAEAARECGG